MRACLLRSHRSGLAIRRSSVKSASSEAPPRLSLAGETSSVQFMYILPFPETMQASISNTCRVFSSPASTPRAQDVPPSSDRSPLSLLYGDRPSLLLLPHAFVSSSHFA